MKKRGGFTLIELLIVIGLIAILAGVVFVALDPFTRFRDARNARRAADVASIASAIRVNQVDIGGRYTWALRTPQITAGQTYQISSATTSSACSINCAIVSGDANCVNLSPLSTGGYLGSVPVSPNGTNAWTGTYSGYYIRVNTNNSITVGACESENAASIEVTR